MANEIKTIEEKSEEVLLNMDNMIKEAERLIQQTDDFYKELGLSRNMASNYLTSDRLTPEQKRYVSKELDTWKAEMESEIDTAIENFKIQESPTKRMAQKIMNFTNMKV